MAEGSLARRYAGALVKLGEEENLVDRFSADLAALSEVLDLAGSGLREAMNNPGLTVVERQKVVDQVVARQSLHPHTANFVRLLVEKGRFGAFDDIRRAYDRMADDLADRVRATVTTALPTDPVMQARVQAALTQATGKAVIVTYEVDPDLIGGVVAKVGDTVFDASVRARLREIEQALVGEALAGGH